MRTKRSNTMAAALLAIGLVGLISTASASPETDSVVAANNQFALDFYGQLGKKDGNLFFSPYCINKTLAMVYAGARGETEKEMAAALHFTLGQGRQHRAFRDVRSLLNSGQGSLVNPLKKTKEPELFVATALWGARGVGFDRDFLGVMRDCYGAPLQQVDFADSEGARNRINGWVEEQTRKKIQNLLQSGSIDASTRLVLASAIYFKGDWTHPFHKSDTSEESFWIAPDRKVPAKLMHQLDTFGYFEDEECQALRMNYEGKKHALVVFLPKKKNDLPELEKKLNAKRIADVTNRFKDQTVDVTLPKFKLTGSFELKDALSALGMRSAFGCRADFRGMTESREPLVIGTAVHKAFVDVNEEGTEAAAATAVVMALGAASPRTHTPVFRADHPFIFTICDVRTGLILFLGRVEQP